MVVWICQEMFGNGVRIGMIGIITKIARITIHLGLRVAMCTLCVAVGGAMLVIVAVVPSVAAAFLPIVLKVGGSALPGLFNHFPLYHFRQKIF